MADTERQSTAARRARTRETRGIFGFRQFIAILYKNYLLQVRSGKRFCGLPLGLTGLANEILVPVLCIGVMCVVSLLPKIELRQQLGTERPIYDASWGGSRYEGNTPVQVVLAPDDAETREFASLLSRALACGAAKEGADYSQDNFGGYWLRPEDCQDRAECLSNPACGDLVGSRQFSWAANSAAATALVAARPATFDAAITFDNPDDRMSFTIHMNHTALPPTGRLFSDFSIAQASVARVPDSQWQLYFFGANLQLAVERCLMAQALEGGAAGQPLDLMVNVKAFPWPAQELDAGGILAALLFLFLLVFAFQQPVRNMVTVIVHERELRLREYMQVLGMGDQEYWAAWFVIHLAIYGTSGVLCALVGSVPFYNCSLSLMSAFFLCTVTALICFSYFLSTLFIKAQVASFVVPLTYVAAMTPGFIAVFGPLPGGPVWWFSCVLPPSAMLLFASILFSFQLSGTGLSWASLFTTADPASSFSCGLVMLALLLDAALFWTLKSVFERWSRPDSQLRARVTAGAQRLVACLGAKPSMDSLRVLSQRDELERLITDEVEEVAKEEDGGKHVTFRNPVEALEPPQERDGPNHEISMVDMLVSPDRPTAVRMQGLTRVFAARDGVKTAVNKLTLDVYSGQVTGLLGHNGAGKTTTIAMLTGMLAPTAGSVSVHGVDLAAHLPAIRKSMGMCPQFDILWPSLTVSEHLSLYAALRGLPGATLEADVLQAAQEVDLLEKLGARVSELSGGQRRKLSVAIAFLGQPNIVILDEPTSGMDPAARRFTWNMIACHKHHCAVLLTTHSMEEADNLCDRIVIMSNGRLAAVGTSLGLKQQYGAGYTLTVVCDEQQNLSVQRGDGGSLGPNAIANMWDSEFQNSESLAGDDSGVATPGPQRDEAAGAGRGEWRWFRWGTRGAGGGAVGEGVAGNEEDASLMTLAAAQRGEGGPIAESRTRWPNYPGASAPGELQSVAEVSEGGDSAEVPPAVDTRPGEEAHERGDVTPTSPLGRASLGTINVRTASAASGGSASETPVPVRSMSPGGARARPLQRLSSRARSQRYQRFSVGPEGQVRREESSLLRFSTGGSSDTGEAGRPRSPSTGPGRRQAFVSPWAGGGDKPELLNLEGITHNGSEDFGMPSAAASSVDGRGIRQDLVSFGFHTYESQDISGLLTGTSVDSMNARRGGHTRGSSGAFGSYFIEETFGVPRMTPEHGPERHSELIALVHTAVPASEVVSHCADEVQFQLPRSQLGEFPALLRSLQDNQMKLGIRGYGLSMTTLEEVFLRVAAEAEATPFIAFAEPSSAGEDVAVPVGGEPPEPPEVEEPRAGAVRRLRGFRLWLTQLKVSAWKHWKTVLGERWVLAAQVAVPVLICCFGLLVAGHRSRVVAGPRLELTFESTMGGYKGVQAGTEVAREGGIWPAVTDALAQDFSRWPDERLDSSDFPWLPPANNTLDAHLLRVWGESPHIYSVLFFKELVVDADAALLRGYRGDGGSVAGLWGSGGQEEWRDEEGVWVDGRVHGTSDGHDWRVNERAWAASRKENAREVQAQPAGAGAGISPGSAAWRAAREGGGASSAGAEMAADAQLAAALESAAAGSRPLYTVMVNQTAKHSLPAAIHAANNALLGALSDAGGQSGPRGPMSAAFQPFPVVPEERMVRIDEQSARLSMLMYATLALSVLGASFIVIPVKERVSGALQVQEISGLNMTAMWLGMLLVDFLIYLVPASLIGAALVLGSNEAADTESASLDACVIAVLVVSYGFAAVSTAHSYHVLFDNEMRGVLTHSAFNYISALVGYVATYIMGNIIKFNPHSPLVPYDRGIRVTLNVLSPAYCVIRVLSRLEESGDVSDPWAQPEVRWPLACLWLQAAMGLLLLQKVQIGSLVAWFRWPSARRQLSGYEPALGPSTPSMGTPILEPLTSIAEAEEAAARSLPIGTVLEAGVRRHRQEVETQPPEEEAITLQGVSLYFGGIGGCKLRSDLPALDDLTMAVEYGECFGLLGTNGAGKSTVFRLLTRALQPSSGQVWCAGRRASGVLADAPVVGDIGYCPQFGGLTPALTARETLMFYARLRGVPEHAAAALVTTTLLRFGLTAAAGRACGTLSGGNQRRLAVAAAMIAGPRVLLLDEPTTGMDPLARRSLWDVLREARNAGQTVVLSSHAMEECDVLCSQVAILVQGELRCIGSPIDLKTRHCGGYVVEARLPTEQHEEFKQALADEFMGATVTSSSISFNDSLVVQVAQDGLDVPRLFEVVDGWHKDKVKGLSMYAISQASLEHVFMQVVHADDESEHGQQD